MSFTGPPQQLSRSRRAALSAAVVLALVAGGCGSDDESVDDTSTTVEQSTSTERPTTSTGPSESTTTEADLSTSTTSSGAPVDPADQEIIDAYVAYWDARFAANSGVPNPQDPALARYATGAQLEAVIAETQKNLDAGEAFQPAPEPANFRRVTVVSVDGDRAEVQECFVDDGQVIERDTGAVLDDGVSTQSVIGNLRFVDGQWRVSGSKLVQQWEGVAGCALAS